MTLVDRFLKYVSFDTQSDESTGLTPSTPKQMVFAEYLKTELESLGLEDITLDEHGYLLHTKEAPTFTDSEVLAVCKILLESRAFRKDELEPMLKKLINNGVPREKQNAIKELISNELFHYIEPQHRQRLVEKLWDLGMAVKEQRMMKISYQKQNGAIVDRKSTRLNSSHT